MPEVGIRELLEAGVHFGHQTRRWNPKMRRFIHGERDGIYIIDLLKTDRSLRAAQEFARNIAAQGGTILFVGTKKQARDAVKEAAERAGMPYVNHRWLGGLLTNFQTISQRIKRLHDLERYANEGQLELLPTRERMAAQADMEKLQANLGGVKNMERLPQAMFVIDLKTEAIGVREAQRLRIPIIGLVDTNADPDGIDFVIPGNDDAIRACKLVADALADAVAEGRQGWQRQEEERLRREAEEQARRAAEEQARREAEEEARQQAEQQALRDAVAREEASRKETLATAEGGGDRQAAEAEVAEAVQEGGRPHPDPKVTRTANTDVATPDPAGKADPSPEPAPPAEDRTSKLVNPSQEGDQAGREEQAEPSTAPAADHNRVKTPEGTDLEGKPAVQEPVESDKTDTEQETT